MRTRHIHQGSCAGDREVRERKAACRLARARPHQLYTQGTCSANLQHMNSDPHPQVALATCRSRKLQGALAQHRHLSSRYRRLSDVVGYGRFCTRRASFRAARVRPRRRRRSVSRTGGGNERFTLGRCGRTSLQGFDPHLTELGVHTAGGSACTDRSTATWSCDPRRQKGPPVSALHMAPPPHAV